MSDALKPSDQDGLAAPASNLKIRPWVLVATILGTSMAMIDSSVVNVALPIMQDRLNATATQVQWVVESYALFLSALILVGGSLGDRLGRRSIYAIGILVFAAASLWCGAAPNVQQLIWARAAQGIGGALLTPGSLSIITATFDAASRGRAIGTWSGFTAITSAMGPVLGGWLVENTSWRWIFFLNLPLAVIVLVILFWRVPESHNPAATGKLDWWGAVLATLGLGGIVYALLESAHLGFRDPQVMTALVVGAIALPLFLWVETRVPNPMMPLHLFRSPTFAGTNLLTLLLYAALGNMLFFLPFNLLQVQGYSPTAAGAAFLPLILLMFFLSRWSGGLIARYGARKPLMIGPSIVALGFALLAVPGIGGSYWTTFFPALLVLGFGLAVSVAPLTTAVMGAVPIDQSGIASGINNAVARTAGLLAIALLSLVVALTFNLALDARLAQLQVPAPVVEQLAPERAKLGAAEVPAGVDAQTAEQLRGAIAQSFLSSFRLVMLINAGLAIGSTVVAAVMIRTEGQRIRRAPQS